MSTMLRSSLHSLGILTLLLPLAVAIRPGAVAHADEGKGESGKAR